MFKRSATRNASFRVSISLQSFFENDFEKIANVFTRTKTLVDIEEQINEPDNYTSINYENETLSYSRNSVIAKPSILIQQIQQNIHNLTDYRAEMDELYNEHRAIRKEIYISKRQLILVKFNNDRLKKRIAEVEEKLNEYEPLSNENLSNMDKKIEIRKSKSADAIKSSGAQVELKVFDGDESEDMGSRLLYTISNDATKTKVSIENVLRRLTGFGKRLKR
jgi:hypothetical protein